MNKFCLYSDSPLEAPCIAICMRKYSYLKDFLDLNAKAKIRPYSVPSRIDCINIVEKSIQKPKCISCMFCVFGCVGNKILLSKDFRADKMCVDITPEQIRELRETFFPLVFKGSFLRLPNVPLSHIKVKYNSFCQFNSIDETQNIAVWGANALKYLSCSLEPRVALEVGVSINERDRAGRLDITLWNITEGYLFVIEAKTTFLDMMKDGRFESQLLAYETVLSEECSTKIKRCKFLLVGGKESDLLPPSHKECTGGVHSKRFYDIVKERNFFFVSANALLALGLMKMFVSQNQYNLESLYNYIVNNEYVGLLSCGLVKTNGEILDYKP